MPLRTYILGTIVCLTTTVAPYAQTAGLPHVAERDVVEGMREKGIVIAPGQVKMLSTIPVREVHPLLEAMKIETLSADASRVLMRCEVRTECIPFYVIVNGLDPNQQLSGNTKVARPSSQTAALGAPMVKKGGAATLEITAPEMVITVPVICLQSGWQGERIKVELADHSRTYLAEIVSPGLLRSGM
jgi:hypothetical protein